MLERNAHPRGARPTYIILDALDECPNISGVPSPREEVLDFVNELVDLHLPNLHICVTSRPEFDIHAVLQPLSPRAVSLHDESGQTEDILEYVTSVVHSDRSIRRWRQEDRDLVIRTLSEKANGMYVLFLYPRFSVLIIPPQVSMGFLSTRSTTPLLATKRAAHPRGAARKPRRDI
jgi:hypothetical protein